MTDTTNDQTLMHTQTMLRAAARIAPQLHEVLKRDDLIQSLEASKMSAAISFSIRDAFEMLECAVAINILSKPHPAERQINRLTDIYAQLPTHSVRSELQVSRQQFSTPAPLALFAQSRALMTSEDSMLEPSAGTGLLATEAARLNIELHLNELDPNRRALLANLFPIASVTSHDGATISARWQGRSPTTILMNPPFSRNADGYEDSFTALRHLHSALKILRPGGRLVAILPNWIDREGRNKASLDKIIAGASIIERFSLAEGCFAKHGTSIGTTMLVIDKIPDLPMI